MIPSLEKGEATPTRRLSGEDVLARISGPVSRKKRKDLLVYIHVPFCTSKCHFCDWVSAIPVKDLTGERDVRADYVKGVCAQIRFYGPRLMALGYRPTMFQWGGGTPSRLEVDEFEQIVTALKESFDGAAVTQHSMECSPETLTLPKLRAMRAAGVDRISMGVQSMDEQQLRWAARAHDSQKVVAAAGMIREAGFEDFNFDLISGFPDETPERFEASLQRALALRPSHLCLYPYRSNSTTVMARQIVEGHATRRTHQDLFATYFLGKQRFKEAGYQEYACGYFVTEPRFVHQGELHYFEMRGDFIGFGPGASSLLGNHYMLNTVAKNAGNGGDLRRYTEDPTSVDICEPHTTLENPARVMTNLADAVMTPRGIDYGYFEDLFGVSFEAVRQTKLVAGLLKFYAHCGADFVDTGYRLYVSDETRDLARLTSTLERNQLEQMLAASTRGVDAPLPVTEGMSLLKDAVSR